MTENGVCSLLHNGRSYNAELIRSEMGKKYKVNTHFSSFDVELVDTQAKYLRMRKKEEESQDDKVVSPMPGKVVRITAAVGDRMKAGDTVVVIEAMKMQSNYKVNSDCIIKEILVGEGENVNSDQILMRLELPKENE
jgi:Acetyl/propionyl-CoA carboxylase, alpha subunit